MDLHQRFAELLEAHRGILFKVAHSYCHRPEDRADLMQEMVLQLWRAFPAYGEGPAQFSTWMYRVVMNVAISAHRKHVRQDLEWVPLEEFGLDLAAAERFYDSSSDNMRTLDKLLQQLDPLQRALLLLFLDGQDPEAIGAVLGISTTNVTTRLSRLKRELQARFAEAGAKEQAK